MPQINRLQLSGQNNIVLQNVVDSVVEIQTGTPRELALLSEYIRRWAGNKRLSVLVLTTTENGLQGIKSSSSKPHPSERYGGSPALWKPFGEASIAELLAEFYQQSGIETDAVFVEGWQPDRTQRLEMLESLRQKVVLVADPLALALPENKSLAKVFDSSQIGGLLVPICRSFKPNYRLYLRSIRKKNLPDLEACYFSRFVQSYAHLEPEIPDKIEFFRRLSNIAITLRGIAPISKSYLSEHFKKFQNSTAFRMQSASFDETKIPPTP
jgi:hypothetical protein